MSIFNRYKSGTLDVRLSVLQLLAFAGFVGLLLASVLIFRHFTDGSLVPTLDYVLSLKLALPPAIALTTTYLYAFLTGESVSDAPKSMWAHLKNKTLQNKKDLTIFLLFCGLCYGITTVLLVVHTPPAYKHLVALLLGGANDDYKIITEMISRLKSVNPTFSERLVVITRVFEERRLWNNENKTPVSELPRIFIRLLESDNEDEDWNDHPLRIFALAEAHSMLAQALSTRQNEVRSNLSTESRQIAANCYQAIIDSESNLTTALMKKSAKQNIGNLYYYSSDFNAAVKAYSELANENLSAGTEANKVAALVATGRFAEAVQVGQNSLARIQSTKTLFSELRDYVALLTNTGFAKLISEDNLGGLADMQAAFDLIPDRMARQNLALALDTTNNPQQALALLAEDGDAPLVTPESQLDVIAKYGGGSCTYLIRAIAHANAGNDAALVVANIAAYARLPQPKDSLLRSAMTWKDLARNTIRNDKRPCGSLVFLPSVKKQLQF